MLVGVAERSPVHREILELDVGAEAGRRSHHDFVDAKQVRDTSDRVHLVVRDDDQRRDGAAMILANLDHLAEQLFLGGTEDLPAVARGESFFSAHGERDYFGVVALGQVTMEMRQVARIANTDESLLGSEQAESNRIDLLLLHQLEIEFLGLLAVCVRSLAVDLFRVLKNTEQRECEGDTGDRCDLLGEQIDDGGCEQNYERKRESER